ncbi:hypothetical protein RND81_05G073200 [Saponaria officinalis]|uniref:Transmembrane protein n=1 Tax=Saponaria officinalis TaxID=3572 RepID=A0AAW1KYF4_SAPOF
MKSSMKSQSLTDIVNRVVVLQKATRAWTAVPRGSSSSSYVDSCLTDNCYAGEVSDVEGFKVYENPEVFCHSDDDDDDDVEFEGLKEEIRIEYRIEECSENQCYKIIFWGVIVLLGVYSIALGFSCFTDQHGSVILLTPT